MNVAELIENLKKVDPTHDVFMIVEDGAAYLAPVLETEPFVHFQTGADMRAVIIVGRGRVCKWS